MRPLAVFDASKREHREYFWEFLSKGSWRNCPYRFAVADDHGHLIGHIQRELLEYYMGRDFKRKKKMVVRKRKKTVDKQPKE